MVRRIHILLLTAATAALLTACGRYERYQRLLAEAEERLQTDSLSADTEAMKRLADYFEDHGTPNEQVLAYYLLGRAHTDNDELPAALHCYMEATEHADTAAPDCDFARLARVYGQMAEIYYWQNLYQDQLRCEDMAIKCAWKGKDTLMALSAYSCKSGAHEAQERPDSAISIAERAYSLFWKYGYYNYAAAIAGYAASQLLKMSEVTKAKRYMDIYESESDLVDDDGNVAKGHEIYYYTKGMYYMAVNKPDSAAYFFRKELRDGKDFNNQNAGSRGLAQLFQKMHMPDSAAKYALYSYAMNDSLHAQITTNEIVQMQAMYNYTRHQETAQRESRRAEQNASRLRLSIAAILLLGMFTYLIIYKERLRRKAAYRDYLNALNNLERTREELTIMYQHESEFDQQIDEKERQIRELEMKVQQYEATQGKKLSHQESKILQSPLYMRLEGMACQGKQIGDNDWLKIEEVVKRYLPEFWDVLSANRTQLTKHEYQVCLLVRLRFHPKSIGNMINLSAASVSKIRINLLYKIFSTTGKPATFDERIRGI